MATFSDHEFSDHGFWGSTGPTPDFTLKFEEFIFSLAVSSCLVVGSIVCFFRLYQVPVCVRTTALLWVKLSVSALLVAVQTSFVAVRITSGRQLTNVTSAAAAVDLLAALCLAGLLGADHRRHIRSSAWLSAYLLVTLLTDAARSRSLFLRPGLAPLGGLVAVSSALRLSLLALQEVSKRSALIDPALRSDAGPETTCGPLRRLLFLFLGPVFAIGSRRGPPLLLRHLDRLDPELSSALLHRRLARYWKPHRRPSRARNALLEACLRTWKGRLLGLVASRLAVTGFTFAQPFVIRCVVGIVGRATTSSSSSSSSSSEERGGAVAAAALVYFGVALARASYSHRTNRVVTGLRGALIAALFDKAHRLADAAAASATTLMSADMDGIAVGVPQCLEIPIGALELSLGVYLLSDYIGVAALAVLGPLVVTTVVAYLLGCAMSPRLSAWNRSIERRIAHTGRVLPQLTSIKMLGLGPTVGTFLQQLRVTEIGVSKRYRRLEALSIGPIVFGDLMTPVIVIASGFFGPAFDHRITAVKVFPMLAVISLVVRPLAAVLRTVSTVSSTLVCFSRIQAFLELDELRDSRSRVGSRNAAQDRDESPPNTQSIITLRRADIAPLGETRPVLRDVDFELAPGSVTGVLGPTGAGKSLFLRSLLGETEVLAGSIQVGSSDIAYCGQKVWLRNTSIRNNVIGSSPYDEAKFQRVIRACFLEDDLARLPDGQDYVVGNNGANLSGGQRQRVALARAAYAETTIVLLDDVFSSLDAVTAICILHQLCGTNGLFRQSGATVLLATYLPQSRDVTDQILFLNGRGTATLETGLGSPLHHTDHLVAALLPLNTNVSLVHENKEQDVIRRSLERHEPGAVSPNSSLRQRGGFHLYKLFINPIGKFKFLLHALLVSFGSALEIIPGIYIRIWIQVDPASSAFFIGYVAVAVAACINGLLEYWVLHVLLSPRSSATLHDKLVRTTMGCTLAFYSATKVGSLLNLFSQDMTLISRSLPGAYMRTIYASANAAINTGVILSGATYLAAVLPAMLVVLYFIQRCYLRTSRQVRHLDLEMKTPLYTLFEDTAAGLTHIRAFGWQEANMEAALAALEDSQKPYYVLAAIQCWLSLVLGLVTGFIGTLLVALTLLIPGSSSQPAVGLSFMGLLYLSQALEGTITAFTTLETSSSALARISMFGSDTPQERRRSAVTELPSSWPALGSVRVQNLFAYYSRDPGSRPVLQNLSLVVRPGERIGIAGRSGSGKTSLLLTLLGFLEFDGRVEIDGIAVSSVAPEELRARSISITQDQVQFDATIRTNLLPLSMNEDGKKATHVAYADKAGEQDDDLEKLLKSLHIWAPTIDKGGLDAMLDEVGYSKGQLQLMCIARAILRQRETGFKVILVDEATSSVDAETERVVHQAMEDHFGGCTVLTIAHRQSSLGGADRIVRLDRGMLAADGEGDSDSGDSGDDS
ncbi:canalicular multispecific organic anion transporter 1 [Cordyceps fumosorosea ARSEF 2679]|uniref:Canalicular multispecific organic anion transporter 1 n=1 Tax=Cordyceps fumosorosea (strain ARSEF 2679) TaxID=1081104 RepID=A0A168DAN9_CORFA|nr:canalicular multispecific organic anion transporter 1 [Cordyceps fumosorosea ARSEF 2679]OAA72368.1 canalicular multispecific organic anion transporter 1 [Cordyceps fumosorosea ARSEF 2679]